MSTFDERYARLRPEARALLDGWLAATDELTAPEPAAQPEPPATVTERALAEIWRDVLDLQSVGRTDDYFAVGGDSIRAIVIVAKSTAAGLPITTHDLFQERTIQRLAELVDLAPPRAAGGGQPAQDETAPPLAPARRWRPLSPIQAGILYHCLEAGRPVYLVQVVCDLVGDLDLPALHEAWDAVVRQHEGLRVTFHWAEPGGPHQASQPAGMPVTPVADWTQLDDEQRDDRLREYLAADLARGFDLSRAPLLRLALFRWSATAHRCVLTHHHLLLDGWSQQIVLADVLATYAKIRAGLPATVPARSSVFDLAEPPGSGRDETASFWRAYLKGFTRPVPLARTGADPAPGMTGTFELSRPASSALDEFCRHHGISLATVVHAGWASVLWHLAGADDVVFGVTVSGRAAATPGLTDAVGVFINTVPARVRLPHDGSLPTWLRHLHEDQIRAYQHELAPLAEIVRHSDVPTGVALFDSIVVVENFPTRLDPLATDDATDDGADDATGGLRVVRVQTRVDEGYPIVVEVSPADSISLRARYDVSRFDRDGAEQAVTMLGVVLQRVPQWASLRQLRAGVAEAAREFTAARRAERRALDAASLRASRREPARADGV